MSPPPPDSSEQLILTALDLFGRHGFDGTSTRMIAKAAGKPMSAITYHFGGKEELYLAVARYISGRIGARIAPAIDANGQGDGSPALARAGIRRLFEAFIGMFVLPESASWARYIVREQMEPSAAFDELYKAPMGPLLQHVAQLLRCVASNRIGPDEARLRAMAMFGQALMFRVARATVLRGNGWDDIGPVEVAAIRAVVLSQVDAILDSLEAKDPS